MAEQKSIKCIRPKIGGNNYKRFIPRNLRQG
jgi:hypothetical protein